MTLVSLQPLPSLLDFSSLLGFLVLARPLNHCSPYPKEKRGPREQSGGAVSLSSLTLHIQHRSCPEGDQETLDECERVGGGGVAWCTACGDPGRCLAWCAAWPPRVWALIEAHQCISPGSGELCDLSVPRFPHVQHGVIIPPF